MLPQHGLFSQRQNISEFFLRDIPAPWEQAINHFYDKFKPTPSAVGDAERNETPNVPTVERDGMDFAGMSEEEQRNNWGKVAPQL
ncbi:MAG: hypothetical protein IPJ71_04955 [Bdellovibrionales bacterium]|nr:hypothetical protein [Bdellovibrionales bacterium]